MSKNKIAVVTGVTGFIGHAIAVDLLSKGVEVYGIGRNGSKIDDISRYPLFHMVQLDFEQYDRLSEIIKYADIFFHAAYSGVNGVLKSDYRVQIKNLEISCITIMQAIKLSCRRYIYVGSVDEFEITNMPDMVFSQPTHSRIYAAVKYSSEVIGKTIAYNNGIEYVSALLALTFGPGNRTNILPNMLIRNSASKTPTPLITGDNYFDMVYIEDAIGGIMAIADSGQSYESYYVGHEELLTFRDIVVNISNVLNYNSNLLWGKYPDPSFSLDYQLINRKKLFLETGFRCSCGLQESIVQTKKWLMDVEGLSCRG